MKNAVRTAYRAALSAYTAALAHGDLDAAFAALERAHVLGQRHLIAHAATHLRMLRIGIARRDAREIAGQVLRLIATVPGFLTGWVPKGNTGGANVPALKPMPLGGDLARLLGEFQVWRDVAIRAVLFTALAALGFATLA